MVAQWNRQCLAAPISNPKHNFNAYLSFELGCEKNENKQKEAGIGPSFNLSSKFYVVRVSENRLWNSTQRNSGQIKIISQRLVCPLNEGSLNEFQYLRSFTKF